MNPRRLLFLLAILASMAVACGGDADRDDQGLIIGEGSLDVFTLRIGDCFQDDNAIAVSDEPSDEITEVADVKAVPCSEPHDNEVYHIFHMPDGDFPGDPAVESAADEGCYDRFEAFVGRDYESSRLDFGWFIPTEESWDRLDDREVSCFLYDGQLSPLQGSMRDSGE